MRTDQHDVLVFPQIVSICEVHHAVTVEVCTGCWWGSLRERGQWGDQDVDGKIILRWIFRKLEGVVGT